MTLALVAKLLVGASIAAFVLFVAAVRVGSDADDNDDALAERLLDGDPRQASVREAPHDGQFTP